MTGQRGQASAPRYRRRSGRKRHLRRPARERWASPGEMARVGPAIFGPVRWPSVSPGRSAISAGQSLPRTMLARWCGARPDIPSGGGSCRGWLLRCAFRGSDSRRIRACTRTGCATTIRRGAGYPAGPLGLDGGVALYGYALQSPMVYIDPRGENPAAVVGVRGAIFCARNPAQCIRACVGAAIAGATWLGIINNSESGGDELGPISPPTEGSQICDECDKCKPRYEEIRSVADVIRTRFAQRAANVLGFAPGSQQWINHEMSIAQRQNQLKRLIRSARSAGCFDIDPADIEVSTRPL
jgi:hypothetical protein